jgi:hypothetical protein
MTAIAAMLTRIPIEKRAEMEKALPVEILPCSSMKPTTSGMLDRWQGLRRMLNIPQTNEADRAKADVPSTA